MEQWLGKAIEQASLATILLVIIVFLFRQQASRDASTTQQISAIVQQITQVATQLMVITNNMTAAIEQSRGAHEAQERAHQHQRDEHKEILHVLRGGKS